LVITTSTLTPVLPDVALLWELHSETDARARCVYHSNLRGIGCEPTTNLRHVVAVTVGDSEPIRHEHQSEAEALEEASYLLDDFVFRGWTTLVYRDPRLD
jgi:hypothetical protein